MAFQFKRPDTFTLVITGAILLVLTIFGYLISVLSNLGFISLPQLPSLGGPRVSPNVIYFTSPVTSLSGARFVRSSGNSIFVEYTGTYQPIAQSGAETAIPEPVEKIISLKIDVPENLTVVRPSYAIPYVFTPPTTTLSTNLTLADLRPGDLLNISFNSDLRLANNRLTASSITVILSPNSLSGTITSVSGNTLTVRALNINSPFGATTPVPAEGINYTVNITPGTEISTLSAAQSIRLTPAELKAGDNVNIYSPSDITGTTTFEAAVIIVQPTLTGVAPATPSPAL